LDLRWRKQEQAGGNSIMRILNNLYFSPNVIRMIKSRRSENLIRRDHLEDVGIDGRIMLEWMLQK
jgi:hypothetical protein